MLSGLTALLVEIIMSLATSKRWASSARVDVAKTLFCTTANGFISVKETCLKAA